MNHQFDSADPIDFNAASSLGAVSRNTAAVRYWILLGVRWMGLLLILCLALVLQSQGAFTAGQIPFITAALVGAGFNALLVVMLSTRAMIGSVPLIAFFGDLLTVGLFAGASAGEPLLFAAVVCVGITGALLQTSLMGTTIHVIGVLAVALTVLTYDARLAGLFVATGVSLPLLLFSAYGAGAIVVAFLVEGRASALNQEMDDIGRQRTQQIHSMRERIRAMYDLSYTMGSTLKFEKVLETALEAGRIGLQLVTGRDTDLTAGVFLFHVEDNALHVVSSRRFTRGDTLRIIDGKEGIVGEALREAVPVFGTNPKDDPELQFFIAFQNCRSIVCVPLRAGYDNFGVLIYGSDRPNAFNQEHSELLTAIGVQATIALQNAVLYQSLIEEKQRIINIEDDARRKLASDLHDGPTQNVAALAMRLNYSIKLLEKRPEGVKDELIKLEDIARRTSVEIRQLLFTWRPLVLEAQGLGAALKQLADKMEETHGQRVNVRLIGEIEYLLDRSQQVTLFHIVEEALNNARKHANASQVNVTLSKQDDVALLQVADNGRGFDMDAVKSNNGRNNLGMINMRERAELIEGSFTIDSKPGIGTTLSVIVPLKQTEGASNSKLTTAEMPAPRRPRKSTTKLAMAAIARLDKMSARDTKQ